MKAKRRSRSKALQPVGRSFDGLLRNLREFITESRQQVLRAVDVVQVRTCWGVGRHIVEFEQGGAARAGYGARLLSRLAEKLTAEFGRGFDTSNLRYMRLFYLAFPNCDALRHELSWTHYRTLLRVEDAAAREWYANEAVSQNWSSRALERQVGRLYYERLLASKDRKAVRAEAEQKIAELPPSPREFVRDPVLLEFLGLPETGRLLETDLEQGLIDHLQSFLLELGKGFAFVARQMRVSTETIMNTQPHGRPNAGLLWPSPMCAVPVAGLMLAALLPATETTAANAPRYFGEPVQLKGRAIYFTSWKYVRQGSFAWRVQVDPNASEAERNIGAWLKGDGNRPAVFETTDMPRGIRLVAQPAEKVPFKEGQLAAQVFDEGKYKAWYVQDPCADPEPFSSKDKILPGHNGHVAYAESADGVNWTRPHLGLYEYAGNRSNNIVWRGDLDGSTRGFHGGSVFVDPSSTDERYKMVYLGLITDDEWAAFEKKHPGEADTMARRPDVGGFRCVVGFFGAVSPDGLHWKSLPEPLMIQHADTMNTCYYDADRKLYAAYVRAWQVNERITEGQPANSTSWITVGRRSIGRAVSKDFRHFSPPEIVASTGADMLPSHLFYTNGKTTVPGCPDNHVMFPWIWELENDGGAVWLLSSADGWTWSRVPGGPVVSPGKWGAPDGAFVLCTGNLLEYPGEKWAIGYSGNPIPHKYPGRDIAQRKGLFPGVPGVSGLATWPKGRLVALQADGEGEFATVFIAPPTERLRVNADVAPSGYLKVAVRVWGSRDDLAGRTFAESDRVIGNSLAARATWKGEETIGHKGQPICLRVQMKQAKLFGLEFD